MGFEKSQIKIGCLSDVGSDLDDQLESAQAAMWANTGACAALKKSAENIQGIAKTIGKDDDIDMTVFGDHQLAIVKILKRYVDRCYQSVISQRMHNEANQMSAKGSVAALRQAVAHVQTLRAKEIDRVQLARQAMADGAEPDRPSSSAAEDLDDRRAKASAEKSKKPATRKRIKNATHAG